MYYQRLAGNLTMPRCTHSHKKKLCLRVYFITMRIDPEFMKQFDLKMVGRTAEADVVVVVEGVGRTSLLSHY